MATTIEGISIQFDADWSEFKKQLRDANKDINKTKEN